MRLNPKSAKPRKEFPKITAKNWSGIWSEGIGACWLRNPELSAIVENALRHFDGDRYLLGSYVIMPNHVHVLVRPTMEHKLPDILQSWKSFTAKEANKSLGRSGGFWQDESFDHIVRDEQQLQKFSRYIEENPLKAGLPEGQYRIGGDAVARASRPCDKSGGHTGETPVPLRGIGFGLAAIKGVGEGAVEAILKARKESGKFKTLSNCASAWIAARWAGKPWKRSSKPVRAIVSARRARRCSRKSTARWRARPALLSDRQRGQSSLFGALEENAPPMPETISNLPEWPQHELLAHEKELLGFYVTGHPLTPYAPILEQVCAGEHGETGRTAQPLAHTHRRPDRGGAKWLLQKSGKPYSMVTLEDLEGSVQILCLNENYDSYRELLMPNKAILVMGEVNTGDESPKIFPQEIMPLEDAPKRFTKQVHLRLHTAHLKPEQLNAVTELVAAHPGKCPLLLCFMRPGGEVVFVDTNERFSVTPSLELQQEADARFGEETYYAKVDTNPPERAPRRWERKNGNNGEG